MGNRIELGMAIHEALLDLGISTGRFAKMLGVSPSEVTRWTCDGIAPSSKYFTRVCEELGLAPADYGFKAEEIMKAQNRKPQLRKPRSDAAFELGVSIKLARVRARLNQEQLARRAGLPCGGNLSLYERGVSVPKAKTLSRLCAALGLGEEEFQKKRTAALKDATGKNRKGGEVD